MKRLLVLLIVLCISVTAFASEFQVQPSSTDCLKINSRSSTGMNIRFELPKYSIETKSNNAEQFHKVILPGRQQFVDEGMPELPFITTSIAIPATGSVEVELLNSTTKSIKNFLPYPAQKQDNSTSVLGFSKNAEFYAGHSRYPQKDIQYSEPMILRDFRIITLQINPFVYDAASKELSVRESMDIKVNFTETPSVNELQSTPQSISSVYTNLYQSSILNFNDYRYLVLANTPPRYLIIHGDYNNANFQSAIDNFVLWKRQKGADVDVATTAVGQAGNSTASIQTYIRNRYNNPATRPDYVILIGDTQGSFAVPCYTNNSGATDYPYTFMNTNDILGDVFIGRISAETTEQLLVILNKIYVYERDIDVANATWLNRMLLVGDNDPSGISTQYISKYIREMALEVNGSYSFTELYGPDFYSFVNSINAAINQGIGFYSYRGFIDFVPPNESLIYNGNMLPHAVLITCATGDYNSSISLGETEMIIRYGSTSVPKGSVTAIGMSTSTTHTTFNNVLHGGIFDGIYTHGMRTMGEALLHGKLYMNEMFGVSSPSNVEKFTHWCNLMGDPTMEVYTGIPGSFQITVDNTIPVGLSLLDVAIRNSNNSIVAGASAVLSQGSVILSRGYTDSEGNVILIMPSGLTAGAAVITVSAHSYKPLIHPVTIANVSTLVPATMIIDDDSAGESNGNGNSIITAGETVELYFGLRNTGSTTISNISGSLSCDSPWVTLMQTNVSYPSITGGATASNNQALVLRLSRKTPHETMLRLHLNLIDSNLNQYHVSEFIEIEAAKMNFVAYQVMDAANQVLDPGETANMNITIMNVGDATVDNVYAELISQNDLLVVTDNTGYFGTLSLNTNLTNDSNNF